MKATAKIFIFFLIVGVCMAQNLNDTTSTSKKGTEVIFEKVTWFKNTYWPSLKDTIKNFSLNLTSVVKPVKTMWNYFTGSNKALLKKTQPIEGAIKVKFAGNYGVTSTEPEDDDVTVAEPIDDVTYVEVTTQVPIATEDTTEVVQETTTLKQKRKHKKGRKNKHGRKHQRDRKHRS